MIEHADDLEDRVGFRFSVLAMDKIRELVDAPGELTLEATQMARPAVEAERPPPLGRLSGPVDGGDDCDLIVDGHARDDRARGRVERVEVRMGFVGNRTEYLDVGHRFLLTRPST